MQITIDVPDIMPANFENPSKELFGFMAQFTDACIQLTARCRQIDGKELFTAFVRDGINSVYCTSSSKSKPIQREADTPEYVEEFNEELHNPPEGSVFMDDDLPGAWVVACLNIEKLGYVTLYSCHFKPSMLGEPPLATDLMRFIVRWLEFQLHTVPGSGQ